MRESIHALRCDLLCFQDTQSERTRSGLLGNDDCSEGAFLIRDGQNARCERVLSVRLVEKEVGHFRIYKDQGSRYFLHGTSKFESLDELIDNYKEEGDMHITCNKRDFKLGSPVHI
ncbi:Protein-tyrosine kinase 6 [Geodia barretti]|uniref:Protein-tyrosine kinase 6 n=1 Tax=Geodia barretti TaxID=519541 RepID=A0AA35S014_GEOBA|nr:Protein-tyrosine kinase 6 [Geodia barretti]CAI8027245.1 Protein-tyrosine kinase 6 [Geodia barretti]